MANEYSRLCVDVSTTVRNAMRTIDEGRLGIALVVDDDHRLLGTITDGDVRRAILSGIDLESSVDNIMCKTPIIVPEGTSDFVIRRTMAEKMIRQIPIINAQGQVIRLRLYEEVVKPELFNNPVVIMAGGLGTRLRPLTNNVPKPLLKIGAKPILETIIGQLARHGLWNIYLSVNYKSHLIEQYFEDGSRFGVQIKYIRETQKMGTAGSIKLGHYETELPLVVMNGDLLTNVDFRALLFFHQQNNYDMTVCVRASEFKIPYGVLEIEKGRISAVTEKPTLRYFINAGIYVIGSHILKYIPEGDPCDMPTLIETLLGQEMALGSFPIREYWLDIGQLEDFHRAQEEYAVHFDNG